MVQLSTASSPWSRAPVARFNDACSLQAAALAYAQVGLPVFPLEPRGKVPVVPRGLYAATCDIQTIETWWRRFPRANIGIPTGKISGFWVLDVDPRHGGLASLEALQGAGAEPLSDTRMQLTGGGGVHLCYGLREDLDVQFSNAVNFAGCSGLDLRVNGGYIVVPPSIHASGSCYRWQNDAPLVPFPTLLVEQWRQHRQRAFARPASGSRPTARRPAPTAFSQREQDPAYWLHCALKYAAPGCRHNYACFLACHLLDDVGLAPDAASIWMVQYAQGVEQSLADPFALEEALGCLDWAATDRLERC